MSNSGSGPQSAAEGAAIVEPAGEQAALKTLLIGGARSGKSRLAEALTDKQARASGLHKLYFATGQAFDEEMTARIDEHRRRRGDDWRTLEVPRGLSEALSRHGRAGSAILIDCMTLWLSNLMLSDPSDAELAGTIDAALEQISACPAPVTIVSNEVGLGLVPEAALGRRFRDMQGQLNQKLAGVADVVIFVAAGLPLVLKSPPNFALDR